VGVVVISGPSGCGKTSVCIELARDPRFVRSVSATTRAPRTGEIHGRDYYFLSEAEFRADIAAGKFAEWAEVYGRLYGTPRSELEKGSGPGRFVVLNIDTQGATRLRSECVAGTYVFLEPPSMEELGRRLRGRGTDGEDAIGRRLALAEREMAEAPRYDFVVVNDDLARAVEEVKRMVLDREAKAEGRPS
jgi:guanylate kinase